MARTPRRNAQRLNLPTLDEARLQGALETLRAVPVSDDTRQQLEALLRGVLSREARRANPGATPEQIARYWRNYDRLLAEVGSDWLDEYMLRVLDEIKALQGAVTDADIAAALQAFREDLVTAWAGTVESPGVLTRLTLAGMAAGENMLQGLNVLVSVDWNLAAVEAQQYARSYSYNLIQRLNQTTMRQVQQTISAWIGTGESLDTLTRQLTPLFNDPRRARLIAQTETTRVYNKGAEIRWRQAGVQKVKWQTVRDESVCPICDPLHNQIGTLATGVSNRTPPAHPGCRCFLRPVVDDV